MHPVPSVRRLAPVLRVLTIIVFVILCLALVFGLLAATLSEDLRRAAGLGDAAALSTLHRAAVALVGSLPALAMLFVLARMAALLSRYAEGEILSEDCARLILGIGSALLVSFVLGMIARPAQILLASLSNPPGERVLALSLGSADLGLALAAGLVLCIGWTQREAARIAEENRGFV